MIDLSENLIARPGNVVLPAWLAGALVQACGRGPAMNFSRAFPASVPGESIKCGIPVGLLPGDLDLMPYVLAEWSNQIESGLGKGPGADPFEGTSLSIDAASLRQRIPPEFSERVDPLCQRLYGLRLLPGNSGVAEPFFENETIQNMESGSYAGTLFLRSQMLSQLLGCGDKALPAIVIPRRLWDDLSALERGWLMVVEAAARWKFSWVREDGCVELEMILPADEALANSLKPLAALGRKLVDCGWLAPALDDAPVLFEPHQGSSSLRLMWVLHPLRAILPEAPGLSVPEVKLPEARIVPLKAPEAKRDATHDAWQAKMRLLAAEELQKIRNGNFSQYFQLKQRYLESLDLQGREVIRDIEQMLAPVLFEEHLRHGIIRYMVDHPSAWQSARSGKPAH